ncbi:hypothetical protein C8R45DRAFT_1167341 [Mycena sanguinolenta]|nr:hypothetical protein C8R45DRAFT_1167341 [Mycena sanguinolenta]
MHAESYEVVWDEGKTNRTVSRKNGRLECKLKWTGNKCSSEFATRSIETFVEHLKRRHGVCAIYIPSRVPQLPFPPKNSDEWNLWRQRPRRGRAVLPPPQSQGTPIHRAPPVTLHPANKDTLGDDPGPTRPAPPLNGAFDPLSRSPLNPPSNHVPRIPADILAVCQRSPRLSQSKSQDTRPHDQPPGPILPAPNTRWKSRQSYPRRDLLPASQGNAPSSGPFLDQCTIGSPLRPSHHSQPLPSRSQLFSSPQAPRSSPRHPRDARAKRRNWMNSMTQRSLHSSHPFIDLRKIGSSSWPSQSLPSPPRDSQLLTSPLAPCSSLQHPREAAATLPAQSRSPVLVDKHPREAPLPLQNSPPRPREAHLHPQNSQLHPREAQPAATHVPRPSSIVVPSVQDVGMANVEPIPSLKRPHSPSDSHGSNKRSRVESPRPSVISRFASLLASPFKSRAVTTRAASPRASPAPAPTPTGTSGRVSALPAPVYTRTPASASAAASTSALSGGHISAPLITSPAPALVTEYCPASPALREGNVYRSKVLDKCNLVIHLTERVAICTKCKHGYLLDRVYPHYRETHKQKLALDEQQELQQQLLANRVAKTPGELRVRQFGEAPIKDIAVADGFVCDPCTTAWKDNKAAVTHCNEKHGGDRSTLRECTVQSVLHPQWKTGLRWVRVDPGMGHDRGGGSLAAYSAFQATWGVKLRNKPIVIPGPLNDNGITLLADMTGWLIHLGPHIKTADGVAGLQFLTDTKVALKQQPPIIFAKEVIKAYIRQGADIVNGAEPHVRYLLRHCPRIENTQILRIPTSKTVNDYAQLLVTFMFALMMSIDTKKTKYRFPFTEAEQKSVSAMRKLLNTKSQNRQPGPEVVQELVPHFHSCIKMFLMKRDGPTALKSSRFASVVECFLAVFAIQTGGILCKAERLTTECAAIKFWIRLCVAFEANQLSKEENSPPFHELVEKLGMQHLNHAVHSEFVRVSDNGRLLATLVHSATHPANLHVTPDCLTFTYLKTRVHLPDLRDGMRNGVIKLQRLFDDLEMGIKVPLEFPQIWKDDWTTEAVGDSFMRYNKFFDEEFPWLRGLLKSREVNLVLLHGDGSPCYDQNGDVLFNSEVVNTIFQKHKLFLQLCMVLCWMTSSGSRGEEFVEYRVANGDRPRSLFVSPDGECTLSPRRIKTEGTTKQMSFIPSVVPPELAAILLRYLIVIRPVRIRSRDGPAAVHQAEFLWAFEGDVLTGDELGHLIEEFTQDECGGKANRSGWRQIITEVMRVYSKHKLADGEIEGVNIHDARMGRSSKTGHVHYGSKDTNMATDELLNFRDASLDLHQILGLGPAGDLPLVPRRLQGQHYGAMAQPQPGVPGIGGPSLQEIAAVVVGALQDNSARIQHMIRQEVTKSVAAALVAVGRDRAPQYSAHSPPLEPLDLPIIQPTDDTNMMRPAATPTSGSSHVPIVSPPREPDALLLGKLRLMLGENAQFKSFQQHDAVHLALERRTSFLALLVPGEGKSILYQLPAFLETGKIIVICPRSALLSDQMKRATDLGIACFHWTASNDQVPPHTRLIFVALESLATTGFENLFRDPELTRVAVDEIHECSTTVHWRPVWNTVRELTDRVVQFLLLSGSVRFGHESRLIAHLNFEVNLPVIRSPLSQPFHQFVHLRLGPAQKVAEFLTSLQAKLARDFMQPEDQGIIFYPSPAAVQKWAGAQSCASWNGWEKRQTHETEWLAGKHRFMHATTTCILGIDNGRCNVIIFFNFLPGLANMLQGAERGSRRGQKTLVVFVTSHGHNYHTNTELDGDPDCIVEGAEMLNSKQGCFRSYFGRAFNGKGHTCDMLPHAPKCQRCAPHTPLFMELEQLAAPFQNAGPLRRSSGLAHHYSPYPRDTGTARAEHRRPLDDPASRVRAIPYNPHVATVDTIDLQPAIREAKNIKFVKKLHAIAALSQLLRGHCGACWALTGRLFTNHHPVFGSCSLERRPASRALNDAEYQKWAVVFRPLTACFRCYMPQNNRMHASPSVQGDSVGGGQNPGSLGCVQHHTN